MKRIFSIITVLLLIFSLSGCEKGYEPAPRITEGEFPFALEYELDGERHLIEDTVVCSFDGYDMSVAFPFTDYSRTWRAFLESGDESKILIFEFEPDTESALVEGRINTESKVILYYGSGGYYLGDPDEANSGPCINYSEKYKISEKESVIDSTELTFDELEEYFGIKIIRFEFSDPIENEFE